MEKGKNRKGTLDIAEIVTARSNPTLALGESREEPREEIGVMRTWKPRGEVPQNCTQILEEGKVRWSEDAKKDNGDWGQLSCQGKKPLLRDAD